MRLYAHALICVVIAISPITAIGGTILDGVDDARYRNLANQAEYDSVGLVRWSEGGTSYLGSGTYIGNGWVLTAAHVADGVDFAGGGNINWSFTAGGDTYFADEFVIHPEWTATEGDLSAGADLALVQLAADVLDVAPSILYDMADEEAFAATLVGFGATGTGSSGYSDGSASVKRAGNNNIDAEGGDRRVRAYADSILFTDFDNPSNSFDSRWGSTTPLELEYMTAAGDSGGGMFIEVDGIDYLAGVTSFGLAFDGEVDADFGDVGGYIRTSSYVDWIESVTGIAAGQAAVDLLGDFNLDGVVDAADYTLWQDSYGSTVSAATGADASGNGLVDGLDFLSWQTAIADGSSNASFGSLAGVPEPAGFALLAVAILSAPRRSTRTAPYRFRAAVR
ncbi:MAG: trypsin-like serine protease [Planctomycetota bacterium]